MKTKAKAKGKKAKGKPVDGRSDPGQLDPTLKAKFTDGLKVPKLNKRFTSQVTSTPVTHQSGKGTRGVRETFAGYSKTEIIRWFAHRGVSEDGAKRAVAGLFDMMTPGVWAKNWAKGEAGEGVPDIDGATAGELKRLAK